VVIKDRRRRGEVSNGFQSGNLNTLFNIDNKSSNSACFAYYHLSPSVIATFNSKGSILVLLLLLLLVHTKLSFTKTNPQGTMLEIHNLAAFYMYCMLTRVVHRDIV